MKVSSNDLYISGAYFKNNPTWDIADAAWKTDVLVNLLQRNNILPEEVIEVGCGAGANLVELSKKMTGIVMLTGYDISPQAIELAKTYSADRISYYNEDVTAKENVYADLVLVIDVVEHVDDYYGFLRKIKSKGEFFIFHIPLDLSCRTIMKPHVMLQQREFVGHIHYYSKEMVEWALRDTGYEIIDWIYTKPVTDISPTVSVKGFLKKMLRNISYSLNKEWSVKKWGGYSVMVLAK